MRDAVEVSVFYGPHPEPRAEYGIYRKLQLLFGVGGEGFAGDILYRISTDNGESWGEEMQLTDHHEASASRSFINGDHIGILWQDSRISFFAPEFYYTESFDLGQTWTEELRLTDAPGATSSPDLHLQEDRLYLFWTDARDNPPFIDDVYFRRGRVTQTSIAEGGVSLPDRLQLSSYPNPFNSSIILTLEGYKGGDAEIKIFDITGAHIKTLSTREGKATWDATDNAGRKVASGIYFARGRAAQSSNTL